MFLDGQAAVITGAARGIGRAIAQKFAAEGASVFLASRTAFELKATVDEIQAAGRRAAGIPADVSKESDCRKIIEEARKHFGHVDILVNNAGILGPVKPVDEVESAEWDEVIAINLRGPFLLAHLVLPEMYARGSGTILNISSVAAKVPYPWNGPYAASKAGLVGLTRTLAAEAARKGVRVNAICPGPVPETEMSQKLGQELAKRLNADPEKLFQNYLQGILQGTPQTVDEIANAALFLVSPQASAITGQTLNVDGGIAFY
ncbi:MAG TPA: SDR family NAD(P)-dependent oxidoreductase [Candidatus Acidoferrales bacterium]|nr:SDR family NAD(P)-dependent oxidoreductase [Candidatus Acidoferrales bacterium]